MIERWETRASIEKEEEDNPSTTTLKLRFARELSNYFQSLGMRLNTVYLEIRFLCLI